MTYRYFSRNGELLPSAEAVVPLSDIAYQYGFGVYETVRVVGGVPYFLDAHVQRLMASALIIGLEHRFSGAFVRSALEALVAKNGADTCNVKVLLIGAKRPEDAMLHMLCLNPRYPEKTLYRDGVACITERFERAFPQAKTLNMLESYLAYARAGDEGSYDALLVDDDDCVREGTRTNFLCLKGKTVYSPPEKKILPGITRKAVLMVARRAGFSLEERDIPLDTIASYDGAFLTSTSSKILPIRAIDGSALPAIPDQLRELMSAFDAFLESCGGALE